MTAALLIALALASVMVDIAVAPGATLLGVRGQVTLVLIALWAVHRPQAEAMLLAPAAGLFLGLLGNEALGVSVLALAPIVVMGTASQARSTERRLIYSIGLVIAGTLVYALVHAIVSRLLGRPFPLELGSVWTLGALVLLNAALAALLYWPLARLAGDPNLRDELRRF